MMVIRIVRQLLYLVSGGSIFDAKYLNDEVVVDMVFMSKDDVRDGPALARRP